MTAHKERITLALKTALEGIVTGASYPITVDKVIRPKRSFPGDDEIGDRWITLEQQDMESDRDTSDADERVQQYWITGWIALSDRDTQAIDTRLNEFEACIEKAVRADTTLGGLSLDLRVQDSSPEPRAAFEGIRVSVNVTYSQDEPFTA